MNKRGMRAFSIGIFFATCMIGSYYFYFEKSDGQINEKKAKSFLQQKGYKILSDSEYKKIISKEISTSKQQVSIPKQQSNTPTKDSTDKKLAEEFTYSLQIKEGMTPGEIASMLIEQKIIKNKDEFQQFLITNQYHTKIQLGTYELSSKMNNEQIAKKITKTE